MTERVPDQEAVASVVREWLATGWADWQESLPRNLEPKFRLLGGWQGWNHFLRVGRDRPTTRTSSKTV